MTFPGHALLIGISAYQNGTLPPVPITAADTQAIAAILSDPRRCGYPAEQVCVLNGPDATRENILNALADIALRARRKDTVFLFYGGMPPRYPRGAGNAGYCLTTYDIRYETTPAGPRPAAVTALEVAELARAIQAISSERVVLLLNTMQVPPFVAEALLATGRGRVVVTACREKQANFIRKGQLTIFAQALVDGLSGQGVDNRGGYIGVYDLYAYLYDTVNAEVKRQIDAVTLQRFGAEQEPEMAVST